MTASQDTPTWRNLGFEPRSLRALFGDPAASIVYFMPVGGPGSLILRWETSSERQTHSFRIEKGMDPKGPWQPVGGWVTAKGGGLGAASYELEDPAYTGMPAYYRLIEREYSGRRIVRRIMFVDAGLLRVLAERRRIGRE